MTITELMTALSRIQGTFPSAQVHVEGWNDMGDLNNIAIRGDVRVERDHVGNPLVVIR